jgi:RNA polymerase sigma factor (sigma-70 family)
MTSADLDILEQLKTGSQEAFRCIVEEHSQRVFSLVLSFVRNINDAEDISQEVFIQAFQSLHDFNGESSIGTWLFRIATNKSLDTLRSRKRKKRFADLVSLFGDDNELIVDPTDNVHPGIQLEDSERSRILFSAVDALPENQKIAFTLIRLEGMGIQEVADTMQMSYKSVESLLSRAKTNLQNKLKWYYNEV